MSTVSQVSSSEASSSLKSLPVRFEPEFHAVPQDLVDDPRWVTWRLEESKDGKATKVPYRPNGQTRADKTAPADRGRFSECCSTAAATGVGVGFVLGDGWVGVDFDRVLVDGKPSADFLHAIEPLKDIGAYAEVSPSGTGVKFFIRTDGGAVADAAAQVTGKRNQESHKIRVARDGFKEAQFFHGGGYFTVTGNPWGEWRGKRFDDATDAIAQVLHRVHAMKFRKARPAEPPIRLAQGLTDEEVLDLAFAAKNGHAVRALYDGSNEAHGGDASAADCALCAHLAFYAGPNGHGQVAGILRSSPRWREKFDREDYIRDTVAKAYEGLTEFYEPARRRTEPSQRRAKPAGNAASSVHEFGLADEFRRLHHGRLVWTDQDRWFRMIEESGVFREDSCGTVLATSMDTIKAVLAAPTVEETTRSRCFQVKVAAAVLRGARAYPLEDNGLAVKHESLNANPWLLGTPEGVLELRTGRMRKGTAADLVTKMTRVAPANRADDTSCPHWLEFIDHATGGDREVAAFLQRHAGLCLTGDASDHAVLWLYGPGGTGKSTYIEALSHVLGEYAVTMSAQVLLSDDHGHPTSVASLHGARFAACSEFPEGKPLNEARLKRLSGGDTITARFMRQDEFSFQMQAKMVAATNHKPRLVDVSEAMARRLHIVEFLNKPNAVDTTLRERLRAEAPGILRWMLDGLKSLLENRTQGKGLNPPDTVRKATKDYMEAQDVLSEWWEECFRFTTGCKDTYLATSEILKSYQRWSEENSIHAPLDAHRLAEFMHRKCGARATTLPRSPGGKRSKGYYGVESLAGMDLPA